MLHKFFIDPRPVTLHTVFEKNASTQRAGVGEVRLVIDARSSQCHLTLKHSQFLNKIVYGTTVQDVQATVAPSDSYANEK